jgi:hypothetical protein
MPLHIAGFASAADQLGQDQDALRGDHRNNLDLVGASWRDLPYQRALESHQQWDEVAALDGVHAYTTADVGMKVAKTYSSAFDETAAAMTVGHLPTA